VHAADWVGAPGVCRGVTLVPALLAGCVEDHNVADFYTVPTACNVAKRGCVSELQRICRQQRGSCGQTFAP